MRATASRVRSPPDRTPHVLVDVVAREEKPAEDVADRRHHVVGEPEASVSYTVGVGSMRVASSCAKYCMTTLWPSTRSPASGGSSPDSIRISVDLPAPLGPTSAMRSPRSTCRSSVAEDDQVAVGLPYVLQLEHRAAALGAGGKREVDPLALGRHLDRHHLVEQLDPALHLRGLRRLIAEPVDEHLDARDLLVLLALGLAQRVHARLVLDEVVL